MPIDPQVKLAGLLVPVFALRHDNDFGIGDTLAMRDAVDFCVDQGFGVLQVLPINETAGDNSPYNAISSVALEPAYLELSPERVPGLTEAILNELSPADLRHDLKRGPVDYPASKMEKMRILAAAYVEFEAEHLEHGTDLAREFEAFEKESAEWLVPYTLFRTLVNEHDNNVVWTQWPPEHQTWTAAENWAKSSPKSDDIARQREFCSYVQWIAFRQWRELKQYATERNVRLVGDMPFGVSRFSADVWAHRELFDLGWSGGAPPEKNFVVDTFTTRWGQNWGIPLYDWAGQAKNNYAWWRQRVRHICETFHAFRIDHVMGFFRIYSFPWTPEQNHEFTLLTMEEALVKTGGREPQFLPYSDDLPENAAKNELHGETLLRIFVDEAGPDGIIAEDLGVVPDYVRPVLHRLGIPGFAVPTMERDKKTKEFVPAADYAALSLATWATHDHDPLVVYYKQLVRNWTGPEGHEHWLEVQRLMRFIGWDDESAPLEFTPELHQAMERVILNCPSCWVVFMITDVLGTAQRYNQPGTNSTQNWSERLDRPIRLYPEDPRYQPRLHWLRDMIRASGRWPAAAQP